MNSFEEILKRTEKEIKTPEKTMIIYHVYVIGFNGNIEENVYIGASRTQALNYYTRTRHKLSKNDLEICTSCKENQNEHKGCIDCDKIMTNMVKMDNYEITDRDILIIKIYIAEVRKIKKVSKEM